jgi:hypothetical protein
MVEEGRTRASSSRTSTKRRRKKRYTSEEVSTLAREWGEVMPRTLCQKLGRTWSALREKATKMGLAGGIPQGYMSFTAASELMGYSQSGFLSAIRRYEARKGIRVLKKHPFSCAKPKTSMRCWQIIGSDVARRVAKDDYRWEAVASAAKLRGLPPVTLRRWLTEAGVIQPPGERRSVAYAESAVIDRVVSRNRWRLRRAEPRVAPPAS